MRSRVVLLSPLLLVIPSIVSAAALRPYPATESGYTEHCLLTESPTSQICDVAIVAVPFPEMTGVRFGVYTEDINWIPLGILSDYTNIGGFTDLSVAFGACVSTPVVAAIFRYQCPGNSPCGTVRVGAAVGLPDPQAAQCDFAEIFISGGELTVNGVYDAPPGSEDPFCFCPPVATEPSTWGKVKALYRN